MYTVQQTQLVTPLQLYFSFKAAFTNMQVRPVPVFGVNPGWSDKLAVLCASHGELSPRSSTLEPYPWTSCSICSSCESALVYDAIDFRTDICYRSMRYSRMLEESSFANRKADYFWLLLLSSIMLLVSVSPFHELRVSENSNTGPDERVLVGVPDALYLRKPLATSRYTTCT